MFRKRRGMRIGSGQNGGEPLRLGTYGPLAQMPLVVQAISFNSTLPRNPQIRPILPRGIADVCCYSDGGIGYNKFTRRISNAPVLYSGGGTKIIA